MWDRVWVFRWLVAAGVIMLSGCVAVPIPTDTGSLKDGWTWTDSAEVSLLLRLYDFEDSVSSMSENAKSGRFNELSRIKEDERSILQHIQLALILGGTAPKTGDRAATDNAIDAAIDAADQMVDGKPLLTGYLHALRDRFDVLGQSNLTIYGLSKENNELRRWRRNAKARLATASAQRRAAALAAAEPLANRLPTAEEEADLLTEQPELPQSLPIRREDTISLDSEIGKIKTSLRLVRAELKQRDLTISDQDSKIEVLEAKIKALSAIERNLNQREHQ